MQRLSLAILSHPNPPQIIRTWALIYRSILQQPQLIDDMTVGSLVPQTRQHRSHLPRHSIFIVYRSQNV